ncbi:MAG TPA: hypothetical protein PKC40_07255 [Saprospiraceae bacterium]|nr:hypothetical protein [Saprospiraceae bacterium]
MINKAIDLISKSDGSKNRVALNLIKYLLAIIISGIIYTLIFGEFQIISIDKFEEILEFIQSGKLLKSLIIFLLVWHLFYTFIDWFISKYSVLAANIFAQFPKYLETEKGKNPPKVLRRVYKMLFNALLQISFLRYEEKNLITGYSFHRFLKIVEEVKEGKDDIDIDFFHQCFLVIVQLLLLLWFFDIRNGSISIGFNVIVTIVGIVSLIGLWFLINLGYLLKMYSKPIYDYMIEMQKKSEKILEELELKKTKEAEEGVNSVNLEEIEIKKEKFENKSKASVK